MADFDRNNSTNIDQNDDLGNDNNDDSDNNTAQNGDNDTTMTNVLHRNNFTAREHLFQAMFSRIALTYDRTFPPFARRFIEFMLLMTALSVLFILIYIHLAFVKAPITCLDHFSFDQLVDHGDTPLKHVVIRVEILSNPPLNYGLFNSYSKEYDDVNAATDGDNKSILARSKSQYTQKTKFLNVVQQKCHKENVAASFSKDSTKSETQSDNSKDKLNADQNQSHGSFYRLFHFPINPIIEKAEYWREKLSVRAMAPFRQTFNELELFAKSVFTEEKYIMEYSLEYGLLRLSPQTRERLNIPVHFVLLDATKDKCFGNSLSRFILQEFVGYDQIIIGSLKRLAERQSGKGYVRNVVSGEHYRFVNSWMSRTSYLAAGFIMIIFTLSVSMLLRYSHHQIFVFIVDLLRMLENNLQFSFPAAPLLTVVLALVGMEAIMSEFFNDTSTAFYTILIIWLADQYEAVCCRTYVSKRHWPRYFYLYHFAFYAYHYRFNGQFSGLALLCSWLFIQHSMFFFFHHYELPRLMQGIAVRAIMDSLIVERAENTSLATASVNPNEDEDSDLPGGDRRDNDDDPGSSNIHMSGTLPRRGDYKPPSQHNQTQTPPQSPGSGHTSMDNDALDRATTMNTFTTKTWEVKDDLGRSVLNKYLQDSLCLRSPSSKSMIVHYLYKDCWTFVGPLSPKRLTYKTSLTTTTLKVEARCIDLTESESKTLQPYKSRGHASSDFYIIPISIYNFNEKLELSSFYLAIKSSDMGTLFDMKGVIKWHIKHCQVLTEVTVTQVRQSSVVPGLLLTMTCDNGRNSRPYCSSSRLTTHSLKLKHVQSMILFHGAYLKNKVIKQDIISQYSYRKINFPYSLLLLTFITTFYIAVILSVVSMVNTKRLQHYENKRILKTKRKFRKNLINFEILSKKIIAFKSLRKYVIRQVTPLLKDPYGHFIHLLNVPLVNVQTKDTENWLQVNSKSNNKSHFIISDNVGVPCVSLSKSSGIVQYYYSVYS